MITELNISIMEEKVEAVPGDSQFAEQEANKNRK